MILKQKMGGVTYLFVLLRYMHLRLILLLLGKQVGHMKTGQKAIFKAQFSYVAMLLLQLMTLKLMGLHS